MPKTTTQTTGLMRELLAATPLMIVVRALRGATPPRPMNVARTPLRTAEQG